MAPVLQLRDLSVVRGGNRILDELSWSVDSDERWVILGPNGAGKTTLLQVASAQMHPTSGVAEVLGERLGKVDVFDLRPRIGFASTAMARRVPPNEAVLDVVMTAAYSGFKVPTNERTQSHTASKSSGSAGTTESSVSAAYRSIARSSTPARR